MAPLQAAGQSGTSCATQGWRLVCPPRQEAALGQASTHQGPLTPAELPAPPRGPFHVSEVRTKAESGPPPTSNLCPRREASASLLWGWPGGSSCHLPARAITGRAEGSPPLPSCLLSWPAAKPARAAPDKLLGLTVFAGGHSGQQPASQGEVLGPTSPRPGQRFPRTPPSSATGHSHSEGLAKSLPRVPRSPGRPCPFLAPTLASTLPGTSSCPAALSPTWATSSPAAPAPPTAPPRPCSRSAVVPCLQKTPRPLPLRVP